jgi:hypothetical protein
MNLKAAVYATLTLLAIPVLFAGIAFLWAVAKDWFAYILGFIWIVFMWVCFYKLWSVGSVPQREGKL